MKTLNTRSYSEFLVDFREIGVKYYHKYPKHNLDIHHIEKRKLLQFANFMRLSMMFIVNGGGSGKLMINDVARVAEGWNFKPYSAGKGMTSFTSRRLLIFEVEKGIQFNVSILDNTVCILIILIYLYSENRRNSENYSF